jgi:hypothetical protein
LRIIAKHLAVATSMLHRFKASRHRDGARPLAVERLEERAVPAVSPFSFALPHLAFDIDVAETAAGVRVLAPGSLRGVSESAVYELDATGALIRKIELAGAANTTLERLSADGRWVQASWFSLVQVGMNPNSGYVYWDLEHPDQPIYDVGVGDVFTSQGRELNDLFERERMQESRVSIFYGGDSATLLIDGQPHVLKHADGRTLNGHIEAVVNGIGGDPLTWIAVGEDRTSGNSEKFIAFADGTVKKLADFFFEQSGENGSFTSPTDIFQLAVTNESIFFLNRLWGSPPCNGTVCGNVITLVGESLTGLPLPESWTLSTLDVSADHQITAIDALTVINYLNSQYASGIHDGRLPAEPFNARIDVNGDGRITAIDALRIINHLNHTSNSPSSEIPTAAEGEGGSTASVAAADEFFFELSQPKRKSIR